MSFQRLSTCLSLLLGMILVLFSSLSFGADTTKPVASLTGIAGSYTIGNTVSYTASATDNQQLAVMRLQVTDANKTLKVDEPWNLSGTSQSRNGTFSTSGWAAGTYYYALFAKDAANNEATSVTGSFILTTASVDESVKLEFDPFPQRNIYLIKELIEDANGLQVRLRVKSDNAATQIKRVDLDWTGKGNTTACRPENGSATIELNELLVCSSKDLGSNPFSNGAVYTMTATAYTIAGNPSNMLKFKYKTVTTSDSDKYTGTQNPDHMEKFWVIDPNTEKKGFYVDTARGTQVLQLDLLHQVGIIGLDFSLQYNSGFSNKEIGILGKGWNHNYGMLARLDLSNESKQVTVNWSNNRKLVFTKVGNEYKDVSAEEEGRLSAQYDRVIKDGDGTYLLTNKDKGKYRFDSAGKLIFIKNKYQQALALTYDGDKLTKVREINASNGDTGIFLEYGYDTYGQLKTIKDATRQVTLYYQNGCMVAAVDPELIEHKFEYQAGTCLMTKYYRYKAGVGNATLFKNNQYHLVTGAVISQQDGKGQVTTFNYDESKPGLIISTVKTPLGYETINTYNTGYQLIDHRLNDGSTIYQTQYGYNQTGMLRRKREAPETGLERMTEYEYDKNGNTTKIIYADGNYIEREYDDQGNLKKETNEQKKVTYYEYYPENNRLKQQDSPYGENDRAVVSYKYNSDAQIAEVTAPGNLISTINYKNGRVERLTDPEGNYTLFEYDASGNVKKTTLKNSAQIIAKEVLYDYDKLGREISLTTKKDENNLLTTRTTYSICGDVATTTDAKGNIARHDYDDNCNLIQINEPEGKVTQYGYDAEDRKVITTNASGHKTGVGYNALGLVTAERVYDGATYKVLISHRYDILGRLVESYQEADDAGNGAFRVEYQEYDKRDRILLKADAHHKTVYNYISNGRLVNINEHDECNANDATICSESSRTTSFNYFDDNKLALVTDAEQGKASQAFDGRGNLTTLKDPKNNATKFDYDGNNKEKKQTPAAGQPTDRKYNALQLLEWVRNGRGQEESYKYYANGWLKSVTLKNEDKTWNYLYDNNGNILKVSGVDGEIVRTFDGLNRVTSYKDVLGNKIEYAYYPNSQLKEIHFDGHRINYTYDGQGLLQTIAWDGTQIVSYAYTRQGRLKQETRNNGTTREYTYTKDRLTNVLEKNISSGQVIASFGLTYDSIGDIKKETLSPEPTLDQLKVPAVTMTYQADNRLNTFNGAAVEFDNDGNMTKGPLGSTNTFANFVYDSRNRLVSAGNTQYTYTIENHRIKVTDNGQATEYLVNPHAALSQILFKKNPDGSKTYYIYGNGLVAQIAQGQTHYYHYDLRGSTIALTNNSGTVTDRFTMPFKVKK